MPITIGFPLSEHELIVYVVILLRAIILFPVYATARPQKFYFVQHEIFPCM